MRAINKEWRDKIEYAMDTEPLQARAIKVPSQKLTYIRAYLVGRLMMNGKVYTTKYMCDSEELFITRIR